jgi:hypothetical protein
MLLVFSPIVVAQTKETPSKTSEPAAQSPKFATNEELSQLFLDDQHDRGSEPITKFDKDGNPPPPDKTWEMLSESALDKRDVERRNRVKQLLDSGAVRTGSDYWVAAMIFHHGSKPDDFLLAHVLACVAISKGDINSRWLAAATLDRFLLEIKRKQIFGTQFDGTPGSPAPDDFDESLLSDSLKAALCVIPLDQRDHAFRDYMAGKRADLNTSLRDCANPNR